jgi:metal-responsive CopG/Arc/MetJ family transcriptional regulator
MSKKGVRMKEIRLEKPIQVRLNDQMWLQLDRVSEKEARSRSHIVRSAIQIYLDRQDGGK